MLVFKVFLCGMFLFLKETQLKVCTGIKKAKKKRRKKQN